MKTLEPLAGLTEGIPLTVRTSPLTWPGGGLAPKDHIARVLPDRVETYCGINTPNRPAKGTGLGEPHPFHPRVWASESRRPQFICKRCLRQYRKENTAPEGKMKFEIAKNIGRKIVLAYKDGYGYGRIVYRQKGHPKYFMKKTQFGLGKELLTPIGKKHWPELDQLFAQLESEEKR